MLGAKGRALKATAFIPTLLATMVAIGLGGFVVSNNASALEGKPADACVDDSGRVVRCTRESETKIPDAPCRMGYRPRIVQAEFLRRYHASSYDATLFGDIVSVGHVKYLYVLEVAKAKFPCLYVASEINVLGTPGKGPYFLGVFTGERHDNYGLSDEWGDIDLFEARALEIVRQRLGVDLTRIAKPPPRNPVTR